MSEQQGWLLIGVAWLICAAMPRPFSVMTVVSVGAAAAAFFAAVLA